MSYLLLYLVLYLVGLAPLYGVLSKAGKPGWAAFVPIYNIILTLEVVGRPVWWVILYFIPIVNIIPIIIVALDMAKSFGRGTGYGIGLIFLSWFFMLGLWLGSATYQGPAGRSVTAR